MVVSLCQAARSTACAGLLSDGAVSTVCVSLLGRCACSSASSTSDIRFAWESTSCSPLGSGCLWLLFGSAVSIESNSSCVAMLFGGLEPIFASAADSSLACESTSCSTLGHGADPLPFKGGGCVSSSTIRGAHVPRTRARASSMLAAYGAHQNPARPRGPGPAALSP